MSASGKQDVKGVMKSKKTAMSSDGACGHLNTALAGVVTLQVCLFVNSLGNNGFYSLSPGWENALYLLSLVLLVAIVFLRQIYHKQMSRRAEIAHEQLDAMVNMLGAVRHKLNNDMQVVLGNAELAEILINTDGNVAKPVQNITAAANDAIERIEQLSVVGSARSINPQLIDLNATLRESMARLAAEMPSDVNLRIELKPLSSRVIVDRYLLSLSLSHLVRQAALSLRQGGEIVVKTFERVALRPTSSTMIVAEIHIIRALSHPCSNSDNEVDAREDRSDNSVMSADANVLQVGMSTTKAIVEHSGVQSVHLARIGNGSLFAMRFSTNAQTQFDAAKDNPLVSQLMS